MIFEVRGVPIENCGQAAHRPCTALLSTSLKCVGRASALINIYVEGVDQVPSAAQRGENREDLPSSEEYRFTCYGLVGSDPIGVAQLGMTRHHQ